jgi:acyl-coenzyme A thioesterase 13
MSPPGGFTRHPRSSPFLDLIGPLYSRGTGAGLQLALRADQRHTNGSGFVHGGILATLADLALGYAMASSEDPPLALTTASLTIDFAGSATPGDLLTTTVDIQRIGTRMAFANCYLHVAERRIARASGIYASGRAARSGGRTSR